MDTILEQSKTFEDISERRSTVFHDVSKALEIVHAFIIRKKRILYGGMAIDLSLKASGHIGIYKEDAIPDYDFMSPDFLQDSYELAIELHKAGFENVSSINALHLTSRRVRVNFISVADMTYIPPIIYERLPTIQVGKLRVIHPDFQRLDVHRAFTTPFENPPMEVLLRRFKKDQTRYRFLDDQYPMFIDVPTKKSDQKKSNKKTGGEQVIPLSYLQGNVVSGLAAYAIMRQTLLKVGKALELKNDPDIPVVEAEFTNTALVITYPADWSVRPKINIATDDFEKLRDLIVSKASDDPEVIYYNQFLDNIRPRSVIIKSSESPTYEIFDNLGTLMPVFDLYKTVSLWGKKPTSFKVGDIQLTNIHYLLRYFLERHFNVKNTEKQIFYKNLYIATLEMAAAAEKIAEKALAEKIYPYLPFYLTVNTYGKHNWSPDYVYSVKEKLYNLENVPAEKRSTQRPAFGFYPENLEDLDNPKLPEFDPKKSELFAIDGALRDEPFKPLKLEI